MPNFPTPAGKPPGEPGSFEQQLAELENIVEQLEQGDLTLEQSVSLFERGVHLSNACKAQLSSAESRIQVLLDPEQKGPGRVEDLAMAVEEDEGDQEEDEDEYGDMQQED